MKIGIIAEGKSDVSVIRNILKGILGIDLSDTTALVPDLEYDETDIYKHTMSDDEYSNWTIVKHNCEEKSKISNFLDYIDDDRFLIIHIDTDTRFEKGYEVSEPEHIVTEEDCGLLHTNISNKMIEWLDNKYLDKIKFAIAIQEIDSWILPIYKDSRKMSDLEIDAKDKLFREINRDRIKGFRKKVFSLEKDKLNQYALLSKPLSKKKILLKVRESSHSLTKFIQSLEN